MTATDVIGPLRRRYGEYAATRPAASFIVATPDGNSHPVGPGQPAFTITVADPRGGRALASLDQFAVATAYLREELHASIPGSSLVVLPGGGPASSFEAPDEFNREGRAVLGPVPH